MNFPEQLRSGDSITFKDYPTVDNLRNPLSPPAWTLAYAVRGAVNLDLTATQDGAKWSTTISSAQSTTLTPGVYFWTAFVTSGSERITIASGQTLILPNLSASAAGDDLRTQYQIDLDAVRAAIRAMVSGGAVQKYVIANRQVEKMSIADLRALESRLAYKVKQEIRRNSGDKNQGGLKNTFVRFK